MLVRWVRPPATFLLLFSAVLSLIARAPLQALVDLSLHDDRYSHVIFMPFVSLGLLYLDRRKIFRTRQASARFGISSLSLLTIALLFYGAVQWWSSALDQQHYLAASVLAIVLSWFAAFVCFYGVHSFKSALFPLGLLLLTVPVPDSILVGIESALQRASAEVTYGLFVLTATPVFRDGLTFSLPGVVIEVARECSGIRSFTALCIAALLLSHFFLQSNWAKACLVVLMIPIAIFKNAVRIAVLSWLGIYVSMDFLTGPLHHRGGPLFSLLAIALLIPFLLVLRRSTKTRTRSLEPPSKTLAQVAK